MLKIMRSGDEFELWGGFGQISSINVIAAKDNESGDGGYQILHSAESPTVHVDYLIIDEPFIDERATTKLFRCDAGSRMFFVATNHTAYILNDDGKTIEIAHR